MLEKYEKKDALYHYRGETCLNCHLPLEKSDHFCPNCGQKNSTKKLSFGDFFVEFFSGLFSYDSRFQRTLRVLLFKPGRISKDYIQGKRTRYANPFRFYLSASIVFFLIAGISDTFEGVNLQDQDENFQKELTKVQQDTLLQSELNEIPAFKENNIQIDSIIKNMPAKKEELEESYEDVYLTKKELDTLNYFEKHSRKLTIFYRYFRATGETDPEAVMTDLEYSQTKWNFWLYEKARKFNLIYTNPKIFADYFVSKLPFIIFFYLPVFALFIWLLYIRRPFNYMEHLVFAFHVQTVLFVLYIIGYSVDYVLDSSWGFTLANTVFVFYLYKAMRNFYGQGRVKTILKFILLNIIFFTLAMVATAIAVIVSFSIF
ncbi:DUF3667 domain-containing protein [Christiangramia sp. SM2212]|uniref:DUF3667 domain-containing protein n=1 Tax=Christiangramia sediminicola TaxID=3073267 RepID=A0ABU1ENL8_9FLAO|nr:DUF3667 domain-containing protein [Christiangramia sp. SM2212]MDR5589569.1 DUF3667 domain-containing protein [Christiangramia sp. SM2212]